MRVRLLNPAAILAALIGMTAGVAIAIADEAPTAMLVIDGSGSMWARLAPDNRAKIDIVRDKVTSLLASPSPARVGLVSFGHRRRGDCSDVELIAAPDATRDGVLGPLAKLNPKGPGPLTAGLKAAIDAVGASRPAQIVVVGDNADNCQQDSCALASDFAKSSPGVPIQVIGIGIPASERPRMSCIAEATGGTYYDIVDSDGLNAALDEAVNLALRTGEPSAPSSAAKESSAPPPPAGATLRASAALAKGHALLNVPLAWSIRKSGQSEALFENIGPDISAKLAAGDYDIEARLGATTARQEITVADGDSQSIIVPLDAAHLVVRATPVKGGTPSPTAMVTVVTAGAPIAIGHGGTLDLYLQPADYTITLADDTARTTTTLTLAAGDDKPVEIDLGTGRLEVTTMAAQGGAVEDVLFTVYEDDPESPDGRREVARSRAERPSFTLPAGTYYISARSGAADVRQQVAIGAGEDVKQTLNLAFAPLTAKTVIAGKSANAEHGVVYRVDRLDGDHARVARAIGPDLALSLPPGRYRVSATLAAYRLSAAEDVVLEAGKPSAVTLNIAGAEVSFTAPQGESGIAADSYWEVIDAQGMPIWRTTGPTAKTLLSPGHYTVRLESRGKHRESPFEVRAGESRQIEMSPG